MESETGTVHSFWNNLVRFLVEVIEVTETLSGPGDGPAKKTHALELVEKWYRLSGISIRWLPGPVERFVVRRIASGLIDALVDLLKRAPAEAGSSAGGLV
jgi:hypothetical protein